MYTVPERLWRLWDFMDLKQYHMVGSILNVDKNNQVEQMRLTGNLVLLIFAICLSKKTI